MFFGGTSREEEERMEEEQRRLLSEGECGLPSQRITELELVELSHKQ